jgi:hypothetical protein
MRNSHQSIDLNCPMTLELPFKDRRMNPLAKFKRDLAKHRGKAALLGILFVAMVALSLRAFLELQPSVAAASSPTIDAKPLAVNGTGADADERIRESKELWRRLKEMKAAAVSAQAAFTFDNACYPPPAQPEAKPVIVTSEPNPPKFTPVPDVKVIAPTEDASAKAGRIREQARSLLIKSTAIGDGTMEPMAIVNQQLVTVGQKIQGFEVSAIRAREVVFLKEGVTTVVRMPDGQ